MAANARGQALVPVSRKDAALLPGWTLLPFVSLVLVTMPLSAVLPRVAELLL